MGRGTVPVHLVLLDRLDKQLADRKRGHEEKTGKGLAHDDYMKHVGRIAEIEVFQKELAALRKQLRTDEDMGD
jgi:hypothetical protein